LNRQEQKVYNTRDSLVVTDPTTSLALTGLSMVVCVCPPQSGALHWRSFPADTTPGTQPGLSNSSAQEGA
ncbi:hypothetical protein B0T16DRAFT_324988, partial [Cercophora newfieldiana]